MNRFGRSPRKQSWYCLEKEVLISRKEPVLTHYSRDVILSWIDVQSFCVDLAEFVDDRIINQNLISVLSHLPLVMIIETATENVNFVVFDCC